MERMRYFEEIRPVILLWQREFGQIMAQGDRMKHFDSAQSGPLHDVRVLDLSRLVAGNMLTLGLADFGADVIKIERPGGGDDLRNWRECGHEIYWKVYGRNKRSLVLDLKSDEGLATLKDLVPQAQVLVENFVPGGLEKMGLGPEVLWKLNPALVIVRVSGWGQTGPFAHKPGFGTLVEAMSGFAYLNGFPDRPPALPPLALADMIAGVYGVAGTLTALRVAEREGKGQVVDLSLFEPIFSVIASEAAKYRLTGVPTMRSGNQSTHTAPRNVYECSDGRFVAMSGSMQSMAMRIFDTIGRPVLKTDPRFATNDVRVVNRNTLDDIIGAFIRERRQQQNLDLFEAAGVTVGPVCSVADLLEHPYVTGREAIIEVEDRDLGSIPMHNILPRLSATPGGFRRPAPALGEHTAEILAEIERARAEAREITGRPRSILYHCMSARSFRPLWMLEELGLPYELRMLRFPPRVLDKSFREVNPLGTVPLFIDGETRMTESAAICQYLAARYGPTPLDVGVADPDFGAYLNYLHFGEATLTFPQTLVLRYSRFEPDVRRLPQVATDYTRWFLARLCTVELRLAESDYLCAGRFTAADVSVGYALMLAEYVGLGEQFTPAVARYWDRLRGRDAFRRALCAQDAAARAQGVPPVPAPELGPPA